MLRAAEWVLGIVGAGVTAFGLVILLVAEDQYVALFGATWRAGDIPPGVSYGLLAGGVALMVLAGVLAVEFRHPRVHK
jgi:TRAP-type C4-dicarboxylate transport system permease small subunit